MYSWHFVGRRPSRDRALNQWETTFAFHVCPSGNLPKLLKNLEWSNLIWAGLPVATFAETFRHRVALNIHVHYPIVMARIPDCRATAAWTIRPAALVVHTSQPGFQRRFLD